MSQKRAKAVRRRHETQVHQVLMGYVAELRRILKRRGPEMRKRFPAARPPCHTCAFNPATDSWRGADSTALALIRAFAKDQPFYCHEPFERRPDGWKFDREKAVLCAGYAAIVGDPAVKTAFVRSLRPDLPDDIAVAVQCIVDRRLAEAP